jgi:hypothetical protein
METIDTAARKNIRSPLVNSTRPRNLRCSATSCCRSAAFSASSRLLDLIEVNSLRIRNSSATIVPMVMRFCHPINTDEVFGTHRGATRRCRLPMGVGWACCHLKLVSLFSRLHMLCSADISADVGAGSLCIRPSPLAFGRHAKCTTIGPGEMARRGEACVYRNSQYRLGGLAKQNARALEANS